MPRRTKGGMEVALMAAGCPCWVHNAAHTDDIEALRRIALWYSNWNNNVRLPALWPDKYEPIKAGA